MRKILMVGMVYIGMLCSGLALASGGMSVQECKKTCGDIQKMCEDICKKNIDRSQQHNCKPGCKDAIDACKAECSKAR
ncbi:MAG: hypothetical protein FWG75_06155 [Cystobacterineae bacterium]|nr:hypothetical protein [Cystobacterineae bacterium]